MANSNPPVKGQAFDLSTSLYTTAGALITNPGTLTLKISKDFGDWGDAAGAGASEEDSTYGQIKIALNATDMNADVVDVYLKDDTSGCVAFKATIYTCSATRGLAGTALPDAAADAAGGLPISDAGGLDMDGLALEATLTAMKGGTFNGSTDSLEALRDRGDAAWVTATGFATPGAAMTLTEAYDAAKTAAAAGAAMTLTEAYDAAKTAAKAGDEMDLVDAPNAVALGAIKDAVQGVGTTLATLLSRIVGTLATGTHNPQSGDAYGRIGAAGANLTALGDTRLGNLDATMTSREAAGAAAAAVGGLTIPTPPSAPDIATAVWAAVERELTAFGFDVEATIDEAALAAAVVLALGARTISITSPVIPSGALRINQGDDYAAEDGRAITVTISDPTHLYGLDDSEAKVMLKLQGATWTAEAEDITETDDGYTVAFHPTAAQTGALVSSGKYEIELLTKAGKTVSSDPAPMTLIPDIPTVEEEGT